MSSALLPPDPAPKDWVPVFRCCWCDREFIQREIDHVLAWICPNEECFERQLKWKTLDVNGNLFDLPMPKQVVLREAIHSQQYGAICIGGERNTGKSVTLRHLCYDLCKRFDAFSVLFLRRNYPELEMNHMRFATLEAKRLGAKFAARNVAFSENDSLLMFRHCEESDDYKHYIGGDFDLIVFEQLEQFEHDQFTEISASTGRTRKRPNWRGLVLGGENPGGPLSQFVENLFIKKKVDRAKYPDYDPSQYHFIDAHLEDNPYADPRYVNNLAGLRPERREMFRFGRRDIFPLQYFKNFNHPARIQALTIPDSTPRLCGLHWAYFKPGILIWTVVLPNGCLYVEREFQFVETLAAEVAKIAKARADVVRVSQTWANDEGELPDDAIGEDVIETFRRADVPIIRSKHDPVSGWQRLQHWFQPMTQANGNQVPMLIVHPSCETVIETFPQLLQNPTNEEDINPLSPAHAARALRYVVMSRPNLVKPDEKPMGRDLSMLDAKTRADIERLARIEAKNRVDDLAVGESGYPWGDFWA